jgi:hypothetical protein
MRRNPRVGFVSVEDMSLALLGATPIGVALGTASVFFDDLLPKIRSLQCENIHAPAGAQRRARDTGFPSALLATMGSDKADLSVDSVHIPLAEQTEHFRRPRGLRGAHQEDFSYNICDVMPYLALSTMNRCRPPRTDPTAPERGPRKPSHSKRRAH